MLFITMLKNVAFPIKKSIFAGLKKSGSASKIFWRIPSYVIPILYIGFMFVAIWGSQKVHWHSKRIIWIWNHYINFLFLTLSFQLNYRLKYLFFAVLSRYHFQNLKMCKLSSTQSSIAFDLSNLFLLFLV